MNNKNKKADESNKFLIKFIFSTAFQTYSIKIVSKSFIFL